MEMPSLPTHLISTATQDACRQACHHLPCHPVSYLFSNQSILISSAILPGRKDRSLGLGW